jgi:hypothetical protein
MKIIKQNETLKICCVHTSGVTCCLVIVGQWGMLDFLFQAMNGCWGMMKASDNVKGMPKDTKHGRC